MTVGPECATLTLGDAPPTRLSGPRRRLVELLVDEHASGRIVTLWELFERGWPGERPVFEAGKNRVYVTLSRLRQAGLPVERFDDGYRLDPRARVRRD